MEEGVRKVGDYTDPIAVGLGNDIRVEPNPIQPVCADGAHAR